MKPNKQQTLESFFGMSPVKSPVQGTNKRLKTTARNREITGPSGAISQTLKSPTKSLLTNSSPSKPVGEKSVPPTRSPQKISTSKPEKTQTKVENSTVKKMVQPSEKTQPTSSTPVKQMVQPSEKTPTKADSSSPVKRMVQPSEKTQPTSSTPVKRMVQPSEKTPAKADSSKAYQPKLDNSSPMKKMGQSSVEHTPTKKLKTEADNKTPVKKQKVDLVPATSLTPIKRTEFKVSNGSWMESVEADLNEWRSKAVTPEKSYKKSAAPKKPTHNEEYDDMFKQIKEIKKNRKRKREEVEDFEVEIEPTLPTNFSFPPDVDDYELEEEIVPSQPAEEETV